MGSSFGLSAGRTGWLMTMPGLVAAVAAPVVTVVTARLDRRVMLCALMALLAAADFLAAAAPVYWLELVSRVLVGMVIGGFWSIGAGLAGRLVAERSAVRATAVIFSAVPLGSVLGVPAGTFLGELAGWRASFVVLGLLTLAVLGGLYAFVPRLPPLQVTRPAVLRDALRRRETTLALVLTCLIVTAHFGTYTYVTTFLREFLRPELISVLLLVYGAGRTGRQPCRRGHRRTESARNVPDLRRPHRRRHTAVAVRRAQYGGSNAPTRGVGSRVRRCTGVLDELVRPGRPART